MTKRKNKTRAAKKIFTSCLGFIFIVGGEETDKAMVHQSVIENVKASH